jgi:hypothetical protein
MPSERDPRDLAPVVRQNPIRGSRRAHPSFRDEVEEYMLQPSLSIGQTAIAFA